MSTSNVYSPYGYRSAKTASTDALGFNGQYFQSALEGYALGNGHRVYNPRLMRFISPDGLSPFNKGGINAYAYCLNDPVNGQDPSGKNGIIRNFVTKASAWAKQMASAYRAFTRDDGLTNNQYWNIGPEMDYKNSQVKKGQTLFRVMGSENSFQQLEPELSHKFVVLKDGTVVVGSSVNDRNAPSHPTLPETVERGLGETALFAGYLYPNPDPKLPMGVDNYSGHYQTRPEDFAHLAPIFERFNVKVYYIRVPGS